MPHVFPLPTLIADDVAASAMVFEPLCRSVAVEVLQPFAAGVACQPPCAGLP
jgi:hypothetical protein